MIKQAYKTVWVRAEMGSLMKKVLKRRQIGTKMVSKEKGFFGSSSVMVEEPVFEEYEELVPTGERSNTFINIEDFSNKIMAACNLLADEGYEVVHISDVIDGRYNFETKFNGDAGWGYGYGYSVTDGAVITARLKVSN